ncbi:SEC-C metal-binding domain-containing protein [uncultured Gimesia sp.]|uniref:HEAT repeat domain-containing protein n=1 Tax=uncultured Gimesia sp. TaxID=1678688 RepID=UPI0030D99E48|tara:strand:- start:3113 stop:4459 length:1347 start_codon:yes stop_codon:yes gene_type:complete
MRLPEEKIKQAILHPELPVRIQALQYFSRPFCEDTTIMPLVIQVVEKYGRKSSLRFINEAVSLPQTESTIQWCMEELQQNFAHQDENQDDYLYASAISNVLAHADPLLTRTRKSEILGLPGFLPEFGSALSERAHLHSKDSETLWNKLRDFCEQENATQYLSEMDLPHANRIVEALGRGGDIVADQVLMMLNENIDYSENSSKALMQGFVLRLAGELRLTAAVPSLIEALKEDDDWFNEECQRALIRIGGGDVAKALTAEFSTAEWHFRLYGSSVLEQLHTDLAIRKCIDLFEEETDETIITHLGQAALSHFSTEAIDPVRQFICTSEIDPEILDLRESLVSVCTVLEIKFPEFEEWKKDNEEAEALRKKLYQEKYGSFFGVSDDSILDLIADTDAPDADTLTQPAYVPNTIIRQDARIGRNDPCPCGSGKKYKKCCLKNSNETSRLN